MPLSKYIQYHLLINGKLTGSGRLIILVLLYPGITTDIILLDKVTFFSEPSDFGL